MAIPIPSPPQLGFPAKFRSWRPNQAQAIDDVLTSDKPFVGQALHVGSGKSAAYMGVAVISKARTMILTSTKGLQTQLLNDFGDLGLVDIRGKSNYECVGLPGHTCEEGSIGKCLYRGGCHCTWGKAKQTALESNLVTTNYACWASTNRYGQGFGKVDLLVMDEAHAAEDALCRAMKITLDRRELRDILRFQWPDDVTNMECWKDWALVAKRRADLDHQALKMKIDASAHPSDDQIHKFRKLSNIKRKLSEIAICKPDRWCVEEWNGSDGFQFDPIAPEDYAKKVLFRGATKVLLVSGTIRPAVFTALGIDPEEYDFFDYPKNITIARTPLIFVPTVAVDRKTTQYGLGKLVERIDEIIESRADRRGIIHTGNFRIRDFVIQNSRYSQFMISNYTQDGDVTAEIVKQFKQSKPPTILVTPSVTTGYDFPGAECRYQIIAKLPFPDLFSSKVEREKERLDPSRGITIMWQHLAQAFGRPDRSEDDWAETFILDNHIENMIHKHSKLAPPWLPPYYRKFSEVPLPTRFD